MIQGTIGKIVIRSGINFMHWILDLISLFARLNRLFQIFSNYAWLMVALSKSFFCFSNALSFNIKYTFVQIKQWWSKFNYTSVSWKKHINRYALTPVLDALVGIVSFLPNTIYCFLYICLHSFRYIDGYLVKHDRKFCNAARTIPNWYSDMGARCQGHVKVIWTLSQPNASGFTTNFCFPLRCHDATCPVIVMTNNCNDFTKTFIWYLIANIV